MVQKTGVEVAGDARLVIDARKNLDSHRVLSLLPLLPYHVVADIGCGPGIFAIAFGKYVFDGKVFALDERQEMLDATKAELERIHLTNVQLILAPRDKVPLEENSLDGAFAAFVLHRVENKQGLLEEIFRCVRKAGWLAIIEWHKRQDEEGPPLEQRVAEAEARALAEQAGFHFASRYDLNNTQYMLVMRR